MIDIFERRWRNLRNLVSRSEWAMRIFGLSRSERTEHERGLVLIQIDGLGRRQFEKALQNRRLPFLHWLLRRQQYKRHAFYPGLPSSTPAVQGELHYGVHGAVPAFCYYEREAQAIFTMMHPSSASTVERRLAEQGEGLLQGGVSYSNIYTGGACESHFCASSSGWGEVFQRHLSWGLPLIIFANLMSVARIIVLTFAEIGIALYDVFKGAFKADSLRHEFSFVFMRTAVAILMREIIVIGAKIDVTRGMPILHINFLGYDEQAHRRGPDSLFAHWSLKGIDHAIRRIWKASQRSRRRDYDLWVFADHGQEATQQYTQLTGRTLEEVVGEILHEATTPRRQGNRTSQRARMLYGPKSRRGRRLAERAAREAEASKPRPDELVVCAMGPIGHIYVPRPITLADRDEIAARLSDVGQIPLVLVPGDDGEAVVWHRGKPYKLPNDAPELLGATHPHLHEVTRDLIALVRHPASGDFVLSGWTPKGKPITFALESGSHAGPGTWETDAFALLPADAPLVPRGRNYLRPTDLREAALRLLGRGPAIEVTEPEADLEIESRESFRIMSYNVHGCVGMDGKLSPHRIARLINLYDPDIVCLQELDVGRARSGNVDQAELIARDLEMQHHFHPVLRMEEEQYGDAILSRFPLRLVKAAALPGVPMLPMLEPRGALWVEALIGGIPFQIINTHFGLVRQERHSQAEALAGPEWLGHSDCKAPVIVCGDFNSLPRSRAYKLLCNRLRDAQRGLERHKPRNTFFGRVPLGRIDHIFISPEIGVMAIEVPRSQLARVASDHLPLIIDLRVPKPDTHHDTKSMKSNGVAAMMPSA